LIMSIRVSNVMGLSGLMVRPNRLPKGCAGY
jgi:hypothetical protein